MKYSEKCDLIITNFEQISDYPFNIMATHSHCFSEWETKVFEQVFGQFCITQKLFNYSAVLTIYDTLLTVGNRFNSTFIYSLFVS